jgi:SAM-dependent methyltransferase
MKKDFLWLNLRELPYFRATLRSVEGRLMSQVDLPQPILDVGCGDGHFASVTYDHPVDIGIDPSIRPLREASRRSAYRLLVQANGVGLPFETASFASAISNSVLEHIPPLDAVLAEVGRVLRQGAPFAFTVPNPGYRSELSLPRVLRRIGLRGVAQGYEDWFMWMSRTKNLLNEQEWKEKLATAGFVIERTLRYFSPSALHALEWGHYFGAPCFVPRLTTGRWIFVPQKWNMALTDRVVRKYYVEEAPQVGTYSFYLARRT